MFDTYVTVVGNVLHPPEMRRTSNTGAIVTTFKIASTARRLDRETGRWVDGNSLRVRVTCWRSLALNVRQSVTVGDPVIVTGRLFTRDWEDEQGARRTSYELEAVAVGHDLSRGRAVFERAKPKVSTSEVEDPDTEQRVGGEATERVPDGDAPARFDDTPFEAVFDQPAAAPLSDPDRPLRDGVVGVPGGTPGGEHAGDLSAGDGDGADPVDGDGGDRAEGPEPAVASPRRGGRRVRAAA
ncbi:MAG: single-stranded DNA-binding protein [Micromonosporaceae bacterium]|jgi:single-strand DNA-binding protein